MRRTCSFSVTRICRSVISLSTLSPSARKITQNVSLQKPSCTDLWLFHIILCIVIMCEKVSPLTLFCPKHSLLLLYEESCEFRRQSTKVSVVQSRDAQLLHFTQRGQSQRLQLPICISLTLYRNKYRNMAIHFSNRTNK